MKNPSIKYIVMAVLLVIFIVASLVMNQGTGNPAVSSEPQTDETSSYVPKSEPLKLDAPSQPVPQQVVIQFAPEATEAERAAYIESIGGTVVQSITSLDTIVVNVSEEVAQAPLPASDAVTASEADYYVSALDDVAPVNDPHYADQWALPAIAAPEAWASMSVDAAAVTIAVIDSGICVSHPDLAGRIVSGWDFVESDTMPQDDFGHGCSVSGVIAANMNDGIGIAGVAPNANIMPLRVLNGSGFGSYSDVAAAVVYAVDNGAQVINLSLGGSSPSSTLENAINYAAANGVIVVAAAGNNGTEGALYPAAYPSVIAVGSIDPNLLHSTFSNYGSQVDVWAPGRDIMSTNRSGDYSLVSGTSFAAPYVAGAEAVYMALSRTPVFAGGLLTFATQVEVPVDPTATSVVPTDVPVVEISDAAVLDQLRQLYDVPSGVDASIRTIEQAGGVMFGLFIVPAPDGVDAGPSAHYFTATQNGDALTISQEYTPQFSEALDALGASGAVSQGLVTAFNSVAAQGDGTAQLGLPWTSGVNATLVAGPHGDGFQPTPTGVSSALDFAPADNKVLASREGYAQQIVCPGETLSSWVIITHPDGWRTSYYQLVNIQVDPDGQQVGRGAYLGDIAPNGAAAFLCGGSTFTTPLVHFSVLRDGKQVKINGFDIGGWTVGASSLTRVSDATVVNVGGSVLNNGTFGTNLTCDATALPAGYIKCADEGGTCSFPGLETVYFGSNNGCFATETATTSISCDSTTFGMPAGDSRSCYVDAKSITLSPACPQSGGVILYWTKDYACTGAGADAGYRLQAASGSQDYGVDTDFNDKASALRVPAGWSVMLYGGGGLAGEAVCVNKDVSDLSLLGTFPLTSSVIDNGVSSMQVFTNSTNCNGDLLANPPKALLPANGSSKPNGFSPILQWAAALNAIEYQAEWWDTDTPNTKNACSWSTLLYCDTATSLSAGDYAWHVKGRDGVGETGWSPAFTFTVRTSADAVFLDTLAITDDLGPSGLGENTPAPAEDVAANAYKDTFLPGDPIQLYIYYTNEYPVNKQIDFEWLVTDPAGRVVTEMSETAVDTSNNANNSFYWHRAYAVPDDSIRGTYTFTGKITFEGMTTTQSQTFTVTGSTAVEVHDAFSTTSLGVASVDGGPGVPEASTPSDVISKTTPTYNAGDNIRLYIDAFNDVSASTAATFNWEVLDPEGRHVPQLEWGGLLTSALNHTWWSLPATIPSNMGTGDYIFTGSITYGGNTTSQTQTFHVNGVSAPANDNWANRITIGAVPYSNTQDTWTATSEVDDPGSSCGGTNSNSVWYRYTPASNGLLEVDASGSNFPVEIGIWTGGSLAGLTQVACNNEQDLASGKVMVENLPVTSGTTYYIELTDVGTPGGGKLNLNVNFVSSTSLTNDTIFNAATITNNITINNAGANTSQDVRAASASAEDLPLDACSRSAGRNTVWYKYTTTLPGELLLDTSGSDYDTMISVWSGTPGGSLAAIGCNDDIGGNPWDVDSSLTVYLDASITYYIQIAQFNGVDQNTNSLSTDGVGSKPPVSAEFNGGTLDLFSKFNPAPLLDLPVDGLYTSDTTPDLSVKSSPVPGGAVTYHFQVDDSSDFSSTLVEAPNVATTSYTLTAGEALQSGVYYWRASAKDGSANYSAWSAPRALYITSLISPVNNFVTSNTKPTFTWGATPGALEYNLQVDETPDFSSALEIDRYQTSGTSFAPTTALVPGDHYWRLRVRTGGAWTNVPFTPAWKFTILQALVAPVLDTPANAASISDRTPSFAWFSVPAGNTYNIQIDTDAAFGTPDVNFNTVIGNPISYQQPTDLSDGTYSWRVRAINLLGEFGPWSLTRTLTIDNIPSDAPNLNLPADNAFTALSKPALSVFAVTGAVAYRFELDTEPFVTIGRIPIVYSPYVTTTSYTLTDLQALPYGTYYWHARSKDAAGNFSSWSVVRTLNVTPMTAPASNAVVTTATPAFTWVAVTGALEYHLQVAKTTAFDVIEMERYQTSGTSYTSPALDYGSHYWRLQIRTASGWGAWAPASKFTVSPALTAAPVLTSPAASALLSDNTPTMTWNKVMDDDRYQVQIDNLSTFVSPEMDVTTGFNILNHTPIATLPDGIYYWRVRNTNYLDVGGTWSASRSFTIDTTAPLAPNLTAPANAASNIGTPAFSWVAPATATKYQFEYDNNADLLSPTYTSIELATTSHTPPVMALGTFYWHVRAKDAAGNWSPWSTARTITINPPLPIAPTLLTPAASAVTNDNTTLLTWNALGGGTPYTYTYEVQLSTTSAFTIVEQSSSTGAVTNYTTTALSEGIHYWRVRGLNVNSVAGPWTAARSFTVDTVAPLAPNLTAPADAAAVTTSPAFTWAAAATASKYQFEYDTVSSFDSTSGHALYISAELTTTSHTPPSMLTPPLPKVYYWHVRAKDAAGNWGSWSLTRSLNINPATPVAPALTAPIASAVTNDTTPDFTWGTVVNGSTYEIQFALASTFASPLPQSAAGLAVTNYTPVAAFADGITYWRVRAVNVAAVAGAWSAARSFTVDTTPPVAPNLTAPADAAATVTSPAFTWAAAATASKYQFEYDTVSSFDSTSGHALYISADLTTTSHTPPSMLTPPLPKTYYWHVRAKDAAGNWSPWSLTRSLIINPSTPVAPVLTAPAASAVTNDTTPDFTWGTVVNGSTYEIQFALASTFASPLAQSAAGLAGANYTPVAPFADGITYWRVRAVNVAAVAGAWSAARSFTVDTTPPAAPNLSAPSDTAIVVGTPVFSWAAPATASKYQFEYDLEADFASPSIADYTSGELTTTSHTPPTMPVPNTYYWHVRAKDVAGNWSPWSAARTVTVNPATPLAPALTAPAASAVLGDSTPDFTWGSVANGSTYEIQFATASTFALPLAQSATGLAGTNFTPAAPFADGITYWRVRAVNVAAVAGAWSASRSFTVDTTPPAAPTLSAPADAAIVVGTPAFSWAAPATASKYQFEYDLEADFASPSVADYTSGELTTTSHTPPAMPVPNTYYWHVRAKDVAGNWSPWSTARTVTVNPATPLAPALTAPAASAVLGDNTPDFTWGTVANGSTYEIQFALASTFASPLAQSAAGLAGTNYTPAAPFADGITYWRVRAVNVAAVAGAWSASRSFTVDTTPPAAPNLSAPADALVVTTTPAFSWAAPATASKYQFEYDTNSNFNSTSGHAFYISADLTTTSHTPPAMALGNFFWHVRAKDAAGNWSPWSLTRTLTVNAATPVAPTLTAPAASAVTNDTTPLFTWNAVAGTSITYEIQFATASTFASPLAQSATGLAVTNYTPASGFTPDGIYYWRARALNINLTPGAWSASRSFTVDTIVPATPALSTPADGAGVIGTPAFTWTAATGASKYQFQYDDNADMLSPVYTSAELTTTSHTPPTITPPSLPYTYYWQVRAKDAAGNWSPWATARSVQINPATPLAPVLTAPVAGLATNDTTPTFTWNTVANGNTYQIQIANASTFALANILQDVTGAVGITNYTATTLGEGLYYWRVRAINTGLVAGAWSASRTFTVDTIAPLAPNLSAPANAASVTGTPAFSWTSVTGASKYQFEYDNNADFLSPTYTSIELTTTSHTPPTISLGSYSWHVRVKDAAGNWSPWSAARTVTVTPVAPTGTVTLSGPTNSAIVLDPTPTFTWNTVTGTATYQIQVDKNSTFSSPDVDTNVVPTTYTPAGNLPDGTYYWRVRKVDIYGGVAPWSTVWRFSVNQPIPLAIKMSLSALSNEFNTGTPTFIWDAVEFGAQYQIQVDDSSEFSSPSFDNTAETTSRTLSDAMTNGDYFWRVRAINEYGTPGPWSEAWPFRINIPAQAPALLLPADADEQNTGTPAFSWKSVTAAEEYQFQLDDSASFDDPEIEQTLSATNYTPSKPLSDGEYYWRVRSVNDLGSAGEWSDARTVVVSIPPLAPLPLTPADDETLDAATSPTFSWEAVSNGDTYQVQVDDTEDFSTPAFDDTAETTTRELPEPLTDGTYFWRVRAMNVYGVEGAWSEVQTFTVTSTPAAPTLLTPETDSENAQVTATTTFSWEAVVNGVTYQLQVDNNEDFSSPEVEDVAASTTRELTALGNGLYYWRVRAINMNGIPGEWSLVWNFTVNVE